MSSGVFTAYKSEHDREFYNSNMWKMYENGNLKWFFGQVWLTNLKFGNRCKENETDNYNQWLSSVETTVVKLPCGNPFYLLSFGRQSTGWQRIPQSTGRTFCIWVIFENVLTERSTGQLCSFSSALIWFLVDLWKEDVQKKSREFMQTFAELFWQFLPSRNSWKWPWTLFVINMQYIGFRRSQAVHGRFQF